MANDTAAITRTERKLNNKNRYRGRVKTLDNSYGARIFPLPIYKMC
jgi:hypothetical protein